MPFTVDDVEKHTKKATTDKLKRQWVNVANSWRTNCMKRGGSGDDCDASAIKTANGVIARQVEEAMAWDGMKQIAKSAIEVGLALANESGEITAERADKVLRKWEVELGELRQPDVSLEEPELTEAEWTRKFINDLPDSSFALILPGGEKDEEGKTTPRNLRKLPYKDAGGSVDVAHLRNALARLPQTKGLTTAQRESARRKLEAAAKKHLTTRQEEVMVDTPKPDEISEIAGSLRDMANRVEDAFHAAFSPKDRWEGPYYVRDVFMAHPTLGDSAIVSDRESGQMLAAGYTTDDKSIEFDPRAEWQPVELTYVPTGQPVGEVESTGQAVAVARDATEEDMAGLSEAAIETGRRAPVIVDFQILQPGPGNSRDNRYYPADVVERDIHVFEGVDVFATDHQEKERSERTKVGKVLSCPASFTESKAPVASVLLYDPAQAEKARNRADADALATLECSILGTGRVKDGEVDGKKYKIVEAITQGRYLELVSKAGAGGKALNLAEMGGNDMTESQTEATPVEEVEEVEIEEADANESQMLGAEVVKEALDKTNLPQFVKATLAERQYPSDSELQAAISEATAEVKRLTGSGQVTELGATQTTEPELSFEEREEQRKKAFNDIMAEVGLRPV